jgi:hypothetical protein
MRARSSWLQHPKLKATWVALAAGSLAGLAVLGACSDSTVAPVAAPKAPNAPSFVGVVGGTAHKVFVCVDLNSDAGPGIGGTYAFTAAAMNPNAVPYPLYELVSSSDPDMSPYGISAQNGYGPWGYVQNVDNDVISTTVNVAPGDCAAVFERVNTCAGGVCGDQPSDHPGNRLWTCASTPGNWCSGIINPYASVTITGTTPPGYTLDDLSCINDDPGNPQTCTNGGYSSANVFHGSSFTYKFSAPEETPCPAGSFTFEIADNANETNYPPGGVGDLLIRYDQFPAPNDNSYGINAVGWPNGHTFGNLVGSDKAGIQIKNSSGTVILSFNMDYISQLASAPSGYASLGVTGGEGSMLVGTSTGISVTTSLANNLNNINIPGLFSTNGSHTQLITGASNTNVLVNSPPTDPAHTTYVISDPAFAAWDFHDTYYARISAAKVATFGAGYTVSPNLTVLHNSPAKPCPPGPFPCSDITVGAKTFKDKEVKIDVNNINASADAFITGVHITWPSGTNGALKQIKVGGDVIWSGTNATGTANLVLADLAADANKRKIGKNSDEDIKFIFANNASTTLSAYTASLDFGDSCNKPILP